MITRERLEATEYGRRLITMFHSLTTMKVTNWSSGNSDMDTGSSIDRVDRLDNSNVVTSLWNGSASRHAVVLDIDHPAWLIPSTTPGHYHLYIDVPGGIEKDEYANLLNALATAGVIETGYAGASLARGYTNVRLPWIKKGEGQ